MLLAAFNHIFVPSLSTNWYCLPLGVVMVLYTGLVGAVSVSAYVCCAFLTSKRTPSTVIASLLFPRPSNTTLVPSERVNIAPFFPGWKSGFWLVSLAILSVGSSWLVTI